LICDSFRLHLNGRILTILRQNPGRRVSCPKSKGAKFCQAMATAAKATILHSNSSNNSKKKNLRLCC